MTDLYQTLGVNKDATRDEIKQAYKSRAMQHHPDRESGNSEAFQAIQKAYAILSDAEKRNRYDRTGETDGHTVEGEARDLVAHIFEQLITSETFEQSITNEAQKALTKMEASIKNTLRATTRKKEKLEKNLDRIATTGEINLYRNIAQDKLDQLTKQEATHQHRLEVVKTAKGMIKSYTDNKEKDLNGDQLEIGFSTTAGFSSTSIFHNI